MLQGKEVSGFVSDEFVKVNETVEEDADLALVLLEQLKREVALDGFRFDHVVHLAKNVHEQDWFVVEILKPVNLFFIEVVHFVGCYDLVVV